MKRIAGLYEKIHDYENLFQAYLNARKDKRYRHDVLRFSHNLESNLIQLQKELIEGTYQISKHREFFVFSPKKRLIMALPFRDRVLQWAVYQIIEPILNKRFHEHSYACRKGKGAHQAVKVVQNDLRKLERQPGKTYYLKMDISKFFYRVDHEVENRIYRRIFKDERLLNLLNIIRQANGEKFGIPLGDHFYEQERVDGIGMAIGDLLSQLRAGVYLNVADQFIKHEMRVKKLYRYMDDFLIVGKCKKELRSILEEVELFLGFELKLQLNNKTVIAPASGGIDFVGYRIWTTHIKVRTTTAKRITRACRYFVKAFSRSLMRAEDVRVRLMSFWGIIKHADAIGLWKKLLKIIRLVKVETHPVVLSTGGV
ncbi:reverse transcriptase domain-containing protein [Sporosarcina sp. ITBMC105]